MRTDRQTDMINQTVTFCNFENVPNKETQPYLRSCDEDTAFNFQFTQNVLLVKDSRTEEICMGRTG